MLKSIVLGLLLSLSVAHVQQSIRAGTTPCRGVNLGGWLVAEHWMTSSSVIW